MLDNFKTIAAVAAEMGLGPLRLMTDVAGEAFWTIVVEIPVEHLDDFGPFEERIMADERVRAKIANYHDLVERGRREIYRVEQ
jgi:hypothetical protein